MSTPTLKDKLARIKKIVFSEEAPAPTDQKFTEYKLKDGSAVSIDKLEVGGVVMIADAVAPDGAYTLEDGSVVTVAAGVISAVEAVKPAEQPEEMKTPEQMKAALAKFAIPGTTPDLTNLVKVVSACFEYCFGWEIRRAEEEAKKTEAIAVYKSNFAKVEKTLADQKEANKLLYEIVENFADESKETPAEVPAEWEKMSFLEKRKYIRAQEKA